MLALLLVQGTGVGAEANRLPKSIGESRAPGTVFRDCADCPEMVVLSAGSFTMGSDELDSERPMHVVAISRPFAAGKTEITFAQWDACVVAGGCNGYRPDDSRWGRGNQPVINVSWNDAQAYIQWLNNKIQNVAPGARDNASGPYRLMSESEWEYAARAGTKTKWSCGDNERCLNDVAWYETNSNLRTHAVATKAPNAFGLYDVHGNVAEWVEDCFERGYASAPRDGSPRKGPPTCYRADRGGNWRLESRDLHSANRDWVSASDRSIFLGFRLARTLSSETRNDSPEGTRLHGP
ncbi:MAG: formylglycine-generating enzyme family protein [Alphaproteobacteria bacterium]